MTSIADQQPRLAGVVGWPIAHSLSPLIHRIWAAREGVNAYYIPIAAGPSADEFARVIGGLRAAGFRGVNVTIPHKEHAFHYADDASDAARAAGAANMLTFAGGRVIADNSDISGFASALGEVGTADPDRKSALVLGAGGAARAIAAALRQYGIRQIAVANRTRQRAADIARAVDADVIDWEERNAALCTCDIIVNTTPLGMTGFAPLEIDLNAAKPSATICDIVYKPLQTPLLSAAKARGLCVVDGLSMLMHQAVPGYKAWLGQTAAVDDDLRDRLQTAAGGV
jgi:shikimate dehydrogenase